MSARNRRAGQRMRTAKNWQQGGIGEIKIEDDARMTNATAAPFMMEKLRFKKIADSF